MDGWEFCVVGVNKREKSGLARVLSVDPGYLEDIGGRFRLVIFGWGIEVYGPMKRRAEEAPEP